MNDYNIDEANAQQICTNSIELFHELFTILDLNLLKSMDKKVLSSLVIIIRENFEFNNAYK